MEIQHSIREANQLLGSLGKEEEAVDSSKNHAARQLIIILT